MVFKPVLEKVAKAYDPGGFIYKLRFENFFDEQLAEQFLIDVKQLRVKDWGSISQEFVALV